MVEICLDQIQLITKIFGMDKDDRDAVLMLLMQVLFRLQYTSIIEVNR